MSAGGKRFPLSLSAIAGKDKPAEAGAREATPRTATPQTATRNAASEQASRAARLGATAYATRPAHEVNKPAPLAPAGKRHATTGDGIDRTGSAASSTTAAVAMPAAARAKSMAGAASTPAKSVSAMPAMRAMHTTHSADRSAAMVSEGVRRAMVARVAKQGVRDARVLAALETVPRHMFLESGMASQAYVDASLPIGHHQTISQPYIVARMIEVMRDNGRGGILDKVLEIGTGCGYQAAVLSLVARDVYSIERIRPLHELAKNNLRPLRIPNIRLHYGDGMLGFPQVAPFDGIILAAAGLEVPQALLEQLAIGGRLVAPVGGRHQVLHVVERINKYEWNTVTLEDCHFVPLRAGTSG